MSVRMEFHDLLAERRQDCDILWVSRATNPLPPHKLPPELKYSRSQAIRATLANPRVIMVIESLAAARQVDKSVIVAEARAMLEEMASKAHLPTVRWLGLLITKFMKRILISVRLNKQFLLTIRNQMSTAQVQYVYAPSHRSYLDFVLLSYILFSYDMALPNIASGMDFYRMQVVGELLRKTGAFYMRRSFSTDKLYKEIFRAYVASIVAHSDRAIEFFIEGTRSRSQKSLAPKYGLLSMIVEVLFRSDVPDIQFIPISISYDRPLEETLFAYELLGVPKPAESTTKLLKSLSILREPHAHGHVYFNFAEPISAREYLDMHVRKSSALSPNAKLPTDKVKQLAYSIIESHKKNAVLMPFNIVALLYNERIHSHPGETYSFDNLLEDYAWMKSILVKSVGALVFPKDVESPARTEREEIFESLHVHKDLLEIDSSSNLRLKERHRIIKTDKIVNVKGHVLNDETIRMSVPAISIAIYMNPTLAFLAKPAILAVCVKPNGNGAIPKEKVLEHYRLLRKVLSTELAIQAEISESSLQSEWEEALSFMLKENCIRDFGDSLVIASNTRLHSLLCNLILPYLAAVYVTCSILLKWDESVLGECTDKNIIKESQKVTEEILYKADTFFKHPYSLSIDLYTSTLSSLLEIGDLNRPEKTPVYQADKVRLSTYVSILDGMLQQEDARSYFDIAPTLLSSTQNDIQAKL
ncbi:dihydroxyacetone phosphate acyltransferase [Belonocnema kinseyi]|uniref:dihydroxyacetone phosphate acyltransferase n=1 Tax=Belonocnema kinseyi TaxID=2817044 RepID=UPI00143D7FFD|nr:dihydroxyacetone phosphate acyltransferase [Belonocnema kinseyi]